MPPVSSRNLPEQDYHSGFNIEEGGEGGGGGGGTGNLGVDIFF